MKKLVLFIITSLLFTFLCLSVSNTYSLFTKKIDKTGSISTIKSEATFLDGSSFNVKIKTLAGNNNPTYETENTTITSIVRTNKLTITPTNSNIVSDSNSIMPIYAWFSNGTLYYYSEANTLFLASNAVYMFRGLSNLTSIDLDDINTSKTTDMGAMFYLCRSLTTLDVSNFDTSHVTNMSSMFSAMSNLTSLNVSNFNTTSLEKCAYMFAGTKIESLDISNFNLSNIDAIGAMFDNMSSLKELKTPSVYPTDTSITVSLPKTMYDENMVSYTTLGKSTTPVSPTSTWLKEGYTVTFNANGGTVNQLNKVVRKDGTYGTLPTPTRDGYTFLGWNGKNMVDLQTGITIVQQNVSIVDNKIIFDGSTRQNNPISQVRIQKFHKSTSHTDSGNLCAIAPSLNRYSCTFTKTSDFDTIAIRANTPYYDPLISFNVNLENNKKYTLSYDVDYYNRDESKVILKNIQLEEGTTASTYEPHYITSDTEVVQEQNHTLAAIWEANNYNLTINPNGGIYNNTTSNTIVEQEMDSLYGLSIPTKEGYTFNGWTLTNNGEILRGNPTGKGESYSNVGYLTESVNTDADGTKYTKYSYADVNVSSITWPHVLYPRYSITPGHTYRISFDVRVNNRVQSSIHFRHGANFNDWNTPGSTGITVEDISGEWKHYSMNRNYSATQLENSADGSIVQVVPLLDIIITTRSEGVSSLDFDIKNVVIEDISSHTYISNSSFGGFIYKYGPGAGTLTANWEKKEATFDTGTVFNQKIKLLAGNSNADYSTTDTNITTITRSNSLPSAWIGQNDVVTPPSTNNVVSSSTSNYPIYAWYDSGTIYYYTEALNPYMNSSADYMFNKLTNLTTLNISTLDTSLITSVNSLFNNCESLTSLDLSTFNLSNVTSATSALDNMTALDKLKTPKNKPSDNTVIINLPATFFDTNDNSYTTINSAPTNTWLGMKYTISYNLNGGTMNSAKTFYIPSDTYTLPIPTKDGYSFDGWTGSNGVNPQVNVTISNTTGNKSYAAAWTQALDGALRKYSESDTNITYEYNEDTKIYTITQKAGSSGWGVGVICDGAKTRIPWGYTYIMQFDVYIPRSKQLRLDTNAAYDDGTGNDEYGTSKFYVNGEVAGGNTVLPAGEWVHAALYMTNNNETRNSSHRDLYSYSAFGFLLTNDTEDLTYQVKNLTVSTVDLR